MALGVGLFVSAPAGGFIADKASKMWPGSPAGRMMIGAPISLAVYPGASVLLGWSMHYKLPLAVPLIGARLGVARDAREMRDMRLDCPPLVVACRPPLPHPRLPTPAPPPRPRAACVLIGLGLGVYTPATSALVSITKQSNAAAAGGALHALMFVTGGIFVIVTPSGMQTMGIGPFITLISGMAVVSISVAWADSYRRSRRGAAALAAGEDKLPVSDAGAGKAPPCAAARGRKSVPHGSAFGSGGALDAPRGAKGARGDQRGGSGGGDGGDDDESAPLLEAARLAAAEGSLARHDAALKDLGDALELVAAGIAARDARVDAMGAALARVEGLLESRQAEARATAAAAAAEAVAAAVLAAPARGAAAPASPFAARSAGSASLASPRAGSFGPPPAQRAWSLSAAGAASTGAPLPARPGLASPRALAPALSLGRTPSGAESDLGRHVEAIEAALCEHGALLRGGEARAAAVAAAVADRGAAIRDLGVRLERLEGSVGEAGLEVRGRERRLEARIEEQGATLRELVGLVRGLRGGGGLPGMPAPAPMPRAPAAPGGAR
jgi:hypothetical protein